MANTPPEYQHAARTAAARVEKMLLQMLTADEVGEVTVVVGWGALEPVKTVTTRDSVVKVGRGAMHTLERVET